MNWPLSRKILPIALANLLLGPARDPILAIARSPRWIETVRGVGYMLKKAEAS